MRANELVNNEIWGWIPAPKARLTPTHRGEQKAFPWGKVARLLPCRMRGKYPRGSGVATATNKATTSTGSGDIQAWSIVRHAEQCFFVQALDNNFYAYNVVARRNMQ